MKGKLPWYVRYHNYMRSTDWRMELNGVTLPWIISGILVCIFTNNYFSNRIIPYEEAHNQEFYSYINTKFEEVSNKIITDNNSIDFNDIPEIVSECNIQYTENEIKISYKLDNETVIDEYYSETGQMHYDSYNNITIEKNIEINKNFEKISETSSIDTIPTHEEYKRNIMKLINRLSILCGFAVCGILCILTMVVILILWLGAFIATKIWRARN